MGLLHAASLFHEHFHLRAIGIYEFCSLLPKNRFYLLSFLLVLPLLSSESLRHCGQQCIDILCPSFEALDIFFVLEFQNTLKFSNELIFLANNLGASLFPKSIKSMNLI